MSRLQKVDLVSFYFLSHFLFSFQIIFYFLLFLELKVRVSDNITESHISHIKHGDSDSDKSHKRI